MLIADPDAALTLESVGDHFRQLGAARQKTPEKLVFVDTLPRTPTGKVQKADLRRELAVQAAQSGG